MSQEIEIKYEITKASYYDPAPSVLGVYEKLGEAFGASPGISGVDFDTYWVGLGSIVRLRDGGGSCSYACGTAKKGSGIIREESNAVFSNKESGYKFLETALGPAKGTVSKQYKKRIIDHSVEIAVYQVAGSDKVFLEVEVLPEKHSKAQKLLKQYNKILTKLFAGRIKQEHRSIFEMFILKLEK